MLGHQQINVIINHPEKKTKTHIHSQKIFEINLKSTMNPLFWAKKQNFDSVGAENTARMRQDELMPDLPAWTLAARTPVKAAVKAWEARWAHGYPLVTHS